MKRSGQSVVVAVIAVLAWPAAAAAAPSTNDDFDTATTVSGALPFTDSVASAEATTAADDPACADTVGTVWYRFTPTQTGWYVAGGTAEPYGAYLSIFTGDRGALTPLLCGSSGDNAFYGEAGITYHFMVGAFPWAPPGDLVFTLDGPAMIDVTLDPRGTFEPRTGVARISGTVTCRASGYTSMDGELRQQVGRVTITGQFGLGSFTCDGVPAPWVADVPGANGRFGGGRATARVVVNGCLDAVVCLSDVANSAVQLSRAGA